MQHAHVQVRCLGSIHWAKCRHAVGTAQAWCVVLAPWWYHVHVSGCYLLLESQSVGFSTGGMGNCLGEDVSNPGHSRVKLFCIGLNVDGEGELGVVTHSGAGVCGGKKRGMSYAAWPLTVL